jgi:H/ACA ribonucleoprotein complex subunit 4
MFPTDGMIETRWSRTGTDKSQPRGTPPEKRTLAQLFQYGVIILDKPKGPTSHQVAAWVKDILGISKAGHGGTLDPNVSGVLPVFLNHGTKAVQAIHEGDKEYVGVMRLHRDVQKNKIKAIWNEFRGDVLQMPPVRSAVKRELRTRRIYESEILEIEGRDVLFKVSCEAGTYIRVLAHDVGEALGVGGHLQDLRRTRTATLKEEGCVTLHNLKDAMAYFKENKDETAIRACILPMERAFEHLPKAIIKDNAAAAVSHGAPLAAAGILSLSASIKKGDMVVILSRAREAVALGRALNNAEAIAQAEEGIVMVTDRVLIPEIFPKLWQRAGSGSREHRTNN